MGCFIWPGPEFPKTFHPGPAVGSPPPAVSFTCAGWIWAAVPILDKVGDNTPASTIFFFFNFQPQYCHFLPFTLSKKKKKLQCLSIFLKAPWNRGQGLIEVVSSCWLIFLSLSSVSCQTVVLASHLLVSRRGSFY